MDLLFKCKGSLTSTNIFEERLIKQPRLLSFLTSLFVLVMTQKPRS